MLGTSRRKELVVIVFFVLLGARSGFGEAPGGGGEGRGVAGEIARRLAAYEKSTGAVLGLSVIDVGTADTFIDIRGGELFIPASNQKLLTAAFALAVLGEEFHFTTSVYRIGVDILVIGDGDPTLGDPLLAAKTGENIYTELDRWAAAIAEELGGRFTGDLLVCSRFPLESFRHPDWPKAQHHRWYAAPAGGLNFHDNCFHVTFTVAGGKARPHVEPQSRFIRISNKVKLGKRHVWSLQSDTTDSQVKLRGVVKGAAPEPLAVACNHPPLMLGRVLADRVVRAGVRFTGRIRSVPLKEVDLSRAKLLHRTTTPLAVALKRANKRSLNLAAECIFLRAGDGTWNRSASIMAETLTREFHLDPHNLVVRDGGGLSRKNRASPRAITRLLGGAVRWKGAEVFLNSLPRSGMDGSMRNRLTRQPYRGRVLGKTGSLSGVSSLSGYVLNRQARPAIAFSIMINRVPGGKRSEAKRIEDDLCKSLVGTVDSRSPPLTRMLQPKRRL